MKTVFTTALTATLLLSHATCSTAACDDQNQAEDINISTFKNPPARLRPRFRYWVPDASVNISQVSEDIASIGEVGAGGIELLGYYMYGNVAINPQPLVEDWAKYGWGTEAWRRLQDTAIQATEENGLVIDVGLGPNQGAGVPAPMDTEGLSWDLQPFNQTVAIGDTFADVLPGWGSGALVSASTALITKIVQVGDAANHIMAADSLSEVTEEVSPTGQLNISFPANATGEHFVIFAYYLVHTEYREQASPVLAESTPNVTQSAVTSFIQNGSLVVDHFSSKGAQVVIDFWNRNLLNGSDNNHTANALRNVGNYLWEDSQEFPANVYWTPDMAHAFLKEHGYSIGTYIPLLLFGNRGLNHPYNFSLPIYLTDEEDEGQSHVADYRQTLTRLNQNYLEQLTAFAESLGMEFSSQVGHNLPMDMLSNIPSVSAPECETLGFYHLIDGYRQYSGPAGLAGKRVISSECGANAQESYRQPLPELLWDVQRSVVGGVNAFVFHGMPYSGDYALTTWPAFTTFFYIFSEMHGPAQPAWEYYKDSLIDYTARVQYVMQSGTPKIDLAFWLKSTDYANVTSQYLSDDLIRSGYSYEYLSPDNFYLPDAYVEDGVLAPDRQAFKALIVPGNATLTVSGVVKLEKWAKEGLPVIFYGADLPVNISGSVSAVDRERVNATLHEISNAGNVHRVGNSSSLAQSLATLGIYPRTALNTTSTALSSSAPTWYTRWVRLRAQTAVFVYNDATEITSGSGTTKGSITFATTGTPYLYDAWRGARTPIVHYSQSEHNTTIPLSLAGNQTTIIVFDKEQNNHAARQPYVQYANDNDVVTHVLSTSELLVSAPLGTEKGISTSLSNGTAVTLPANNNPSIPLTQWSLTVESWKPPANLSNIQGTVKTNLTAFNVTSPLLPWNQLRSGPNLTHVAGRGFYKSSFIWDHTALTTSALTGAVITLGPILHTVVVFVNGEKLAPLDPTAPQADISQYLRQGTNDLEIVVSTPLGNAIIPFADKLRTANGGVLSSFSVAEYGLVGEILIQQYYAVLL